MIMSQVLEWQVIKLVGSRYEHQMTDRTHFRHGENPSSLRIGDEKVPIKVPRVRNMETKKCSSPELWNKIRSGIKPDIHQMYAVLNGISTRNYKDSVHTTLDGFGLSRNEVSENFIEYSEDLLQEFNERKWTENTYTALFIDGIDLGGQ